LNPGTLNFKVIIFNGITHYSKPKKLIIVHLTKKSAQYNNRSIYFLS
jgi:hypothetical protein